MVNTSRNRPDLFAPLPGERAPVIPILAILEHGYPLEPRPALAIQPRWRIALGFLCGAGLLAVLAGWIGANAPPPAPDPVFRVQAPTTTHMPQPELERRAAAIVNEPLQNHVQRGNDRAAHLPPATPAPAATTPAVRTAASATQAAAMRPQLAARRAPADIGQVGDNEGDRDVALLSALIAHGKVRK